MPILLHKWDTLISTTLDPLNANLVSFSDEAINIFIYQSKAERENVRNLLIEGIVDRPKIRDKQQYVQVNQPILIRLLDKLYSYKQTEGLSDKMLYLYTAINRHLENTLNFIEDFFSNYFDRNEKVPVAYLTVSSEAMQATTGIATDRKIE